MAIKTRDGLVHHVNRPETDSTYGKTSCDRGFTIDPEHIKRVVEGNAGWDDVVPAKLSKKPPTCLQCVSASSG